MSDDLFAEPPALPVAPSPDYKQRYVAYLDVLGFSSFVEWIDQHPENRASVHSVITKLRNTLVKNPHRGAFMFTQFSDCVVLSADRTAEGLAAVIHGALILHRNLLGDGFLLRGGIAVGNLTHTDDAIFGLGFLKAYAFDKSGSPPRIALSSDVTADIATYDPTWKWDIVVGADHVDGSPMLNTLYEMEGYGSRPPQAGDLVLDRPAAQIAQGISSMACNRTLDTRVRAKWIWFRDYWNQAVSKQGILPKSVWLE